MLEPEPPPVPVLADKTNGHLDVYFSSTLTPGPLNAGNWFIREANTAWLPIGPTAVLPNRVSIDLFGLGPDVGPDVVSYSPPPFDVVGPGGPAAAFADYPIT